MPRIPHLTRPVTRQVETPTYGRLIVTINPSGLEIREYRRKASFMLPYGVAFQRAVQLHVALERANAPHRSRRKPRRK